MARKRALVVDDSKSARVILSRMLEKYDIEVDMADSAESAIEYLKHNRPDAIFMDHLMPGMDGLQAVQAIKGNPHTAMIPIMMYTSQEGELYVGQARALGALGVLPKQVRPVDVSKVLYELHLLPDRRDLEEPALAPVETGGAQEKSAQTRSTSVAAVDIRRFIVASLDSFAVRIVGEMRDMMPIHTNDPIAPPPRPPRSTWNVPGGALLAVALLTAAFAASWFVAHNELAAARADMAGLKSANAELQRSRDELSGTVKDLTAALAANTAATGAAAAGPAMSGAPGAPGAPAAGAAPSATRVEPVPYGEIPFDHSRLEVLRDLLTTLESQGFHGVLRITNQAGIFCLSGNSTDGYTPASASLPLAKCDVIGNPFEDSLSGQQRQSLAFANLIAGVRQRTLGAITVMLDSDGTVTRVNTPYPARTESITAGEWNRAAAANNRVDFTAESAGP
jgi:CheY-like chemotaxis protein